MRKKVTLNTTVADFIEIVKNQMLSNIQAKELLDSLGENVSKNIISDIYLAAGFEIIDARKKIIEPTSNVNYEIQLKDAINLARSMRTEKEKQSKDPVKSVTEKTKVPVIINVPKNVQTEEQFVGITHSNPFELEQPEQAQDFILAALGLTKNQLVVLKQLTDQGEFVGTNSNESIYEAIKQLGGRERTNKTYYISKEIIELSAAFCEDKSVKVSQFVETALLDALKKYK